MQSVPIATKVESSNLAYGEVYSIPLYVIKFVSDLQQVGVFFPGTPISFTNETDRHDIDEILLKVMLNTITHPTSIPNTKADLKKVQLRQVSL